MESALHKGRQAQVADVICGPDRSTTEASAAAIRGPAPRTRCGLVDAPRRDMPK